MSVTATVPSSFDLTINGQERGQLLALLERSLRDTHVEARRTEAPDYQEMVHHKEVVLRGLIDKLRER
jgi:hypothetical protein